MLYFFQFFLYNSEAWADYLNWKTNPDPIGISILSFFVWVSQEKLS